MFYNRPHRFYCGVDLHARTLFTHVLDAKGKTVFEQDLPADPKALLTAIKPFRKDLVVGCECMFAWYWLADRCEDQGIPFALGHALAMRLIHGAKTKTDRIDAAKLAALLRRGLFPMGRSETKRRPSAYPRPRRPTSAGWPATPPPWRGRRSGRRPPRTRGPAATAGPLAAPPWSSPARAPTWNPWRPPRTG